MGAWIEISTPAYNYEIITVAPLVGAWIEIEAYDRNKYSNAVAPLVGAWIEIKAELKLMTPGQVSLLSWERGLK